MTDAPREIQGQVEKVERKEPPEPEGWIVLFGNRLGPRGEEEFVWRSWSTINKTREAALRQVDSSPVGDHRLVYISPAPPSPQPQTGKEVEAALRSIDSAARWLTECNIPGATENPRGALRYGALEIVPSLERAIETLRRALGQNAQTGAEFKSMENALRRLSMAMHNPCIDFTDSNIETALVNFAASVIEGRGWPLPERQERCPSCDFEPKHGHFEGCRLGPQTGVPREQAEREREQDERDAEMFRRGFKAGETHAKAGAPAANVVACHMHDLLEADHASDQDRPSGAERSPGPNVDAPDPESFPVESWHHLNAVHAAVERRPDERGEAEAAHPLEERAWRRVNLDGWAIGPDGHLYIRLAAIRQLGEFDGIEGEIPGVTEEKLEAVAASTARIRDLVSARFLSWLTDDGKP